MNAASASNRALAITNPLVLYRALVATKKIESDPAQHRLAIHLQKLYHRLKDYEPQVEYRQKLNQLSSVLNDPKRSPGPPDGDVKPVFSPFWRQQKADKGSLALIRTITGHESALSIDSPQGLLLHGEVGTGKSMLVDLLANSLPNRKKRRWHFNTFMLEAFAKLEKLRIRRLVEMRDASGLHEEHSLLSFARDMIETSPILFLDEFQFPDRAASKILSNLFTSFFHLGGVLIATSNRMPEELAKASGLEFGPPASSPPASQSLKDAILGRSRSGREIKSTQEQKSDFAAFLEVLRARCEVWEMEGERDWRRKTFRENRSKEAVSGSIGDGALPADQPEDEDGSLPQYYHLTPAEVFESGQKDLSAGFHEAVIKSLPGFQSTSHSFVSITWKSATLRVFGRVLTIPKCFNKISLWSFPELCARNLGPADYVSLASTFHTFILIDVPVLSLLEKNEARRFITLLDALYEAKCKLLIQASAGPDDLFFPETRSRTPDPNSRTSSEMSQDGTYAETFSEIYQDRTSPFRPNISAYTPSASSPEYDVQPLPHIHHHDTTTNTKARHSPSTTHPSPRSILADEDSDFGPVYGAGRSIGTSSSQGTGPFARDERSPPTPASGTMVRRPNF
ncbi:MAG: hypothetical protein LQ340_002415, partial [Diploschistes diacapsis]